MMIPRRIRYAILFASTGLVSLLPALTTPAAATPGIATATGQACGTCHVSPAGGGPRNALGMRFEALSNHDSAPAAAFASLTAAAPATGAPAPAAPAPAAPAPAAPAPFTLDQLTAIQPSMGTVMIEYARRMSLMWFGAQAGNWDFADFQLGGMRSIQKVAETTDPDRASSLRAFASGSLDPLGAAISGKDIAGFRTTYSAAIQSCNSCHAGTVDSDFPNGHGFIRIQVPTNTLDSLYVFALNGGTTGASASGVNLAVGNPSPGDTVQAGAYAIEGAASGIDHIDIFLDNRDTGGSTLGSTTVAPTGQWHAVISISHNQAGLRTLYFYGHSTGSSAETIVAVPVTVAH